MGLPHAVTVQAAFQGQKDFTQVSTLGLQDEKYDSLNHIHDTVTHLNTQRAVIPSSYCVVLWLGPGSAPL